MKISLNTLKKYCTKLTSNTTQVIQLFDMLGLEVKKAQQEGEDVVLTLELLANRGDHHSYLGIAREVAAKINCELTYPAVAEVVADETQKNFSIETDKCFAYQLTRIRLGQFSSLTAELNQLLNVVSASTGNSVVDITNIVNYELGQPLHAFDASKISGKICIRLSKETEQAHLLFTEEPTELPVDTVVIADDTKILAVAGVIGCIGSEVTEETKEILLESAQFDPVSVRIAAQKLKLSTEASTRFERGTDIGMVDYATRRAFYLLKQFCQAELVESEQFKIAAQDKVINLSLSKVSTYYGRDFSQVEITECLQKYGFTVAEHAAGELTITVPAHRFWDVEHVQCLYEEIGRYYDYNSFDEYLPEIVPEIRGQVSANKTYINQALVQFGFTEVYTDSFYSRSLVTRFDQGSERLAAHLETTNAVDKAFTLLKNNCLYQGLEALEKNANDGLKSVNIFEWSTIFHPTSGKKISEEKSVMWGMVSGHPELEQWNCSRPKENFFFVKGILQQVCQGLRFSLSFKIPETPEQTEYLHPKKQLLICINNRTVGFFGQVHPALVQDLKIKDKQPIFFQLSAEVLDLSSQANSYNFQEQTRQDSIRVVTFDIQAELDSADIISLIKQSNVQAIKSVNIVDVFNDKSSDKTALTYEIVIDGALKVDREAFNEIAQKAAQFVIESDERITMR